VIVTPRRQSRPNRPDGQCPFCPGGLEAPGEYEVFCFQNRWPALPDGRHEVILHSPAHDATFLTLGVPGTARVIELWSDRTAHFQSRQDVRYVFIFENRGRAVGSTIDHPHSQVLAFGHVPPVVAAEVAAVTCQLCTAPDERLVVLRREGWLAYVPWAPSWPYELVIRPDRHVADLPEAGQSLRAGLAAVLVDCLRRVQRVLGEAAPYLLWVHQRPAHLHLHLASVLRARGVTRHLAGAEFGAGVFFDPADPLAVAVELSEAGRTPGA
jgi:UDPglucose--hexose-1-phosphate uridylyltransferase